jgi:hypothetical protein
VQQARRIYDAEHLPADKQLPPQRRYAGAAGR